MSTIFSTSEFSKVLGPLMQIRIKQSKFTLYVLSGILSGEQIKLITGKPRSTFDVVRCITKTILKKVVICVNGFKEPSVYLLQNF